MKIAKEIKIGLLVTAGIALLVYGFNFLKGTNIFVGQRTFYAVYKNIDGLMESNPVQLNGFKVGQVNRINFYSDRSGKILVTFKINNNDIDIPRGTVARVVSSDLLGSKAVDLVLGKEKSSVNDGDTLASDIQATLTEEVNKQVLPLKNKAEKLISSIDSVMSVVQAVFNKDARENLSKSFESIKKAIETFERTSMTMDTLVRSEKNKLSNIFSKIESISSTIANNNDKISNAINNFSNLSDSLAKSNIKATINHTNEALSQASDIMNKINRGEGTMGILINNDKLYKQLDSASVNLDRLLTDMKEHPKRYVHFSVIGRKDRPSKPKK